MTIDKEKLKALAERTVASNPPGGDGNPFPALAVRAVDVLALLAEIERLTPPAGQVSYQEQMEAWKSASSQDLRARGELMIQLEELEAENESLRKDAERYRWLCDRFGVTKLPCAVERILAGDVYVADGKPGVDGAIDAAMSKEAQPCS